MSQKREIQAAAGYDKGIEAVSSLLEKFRIEAAFVGQVAEGVWLDERVDRGSVDVLAVVGPDRRQQIPMMAMAQNRCFQVDREAVEAAQELDLIPMTFKAEGRSMAVNILIASNALYSVMIRDSVTAKLADRDVRVVRAEDLALLLVVDDSEEAKSKVRRIVETASEDFDVEQFNRRLESIGLGSRRIS